MGSITLALDFTLNELETSSHLHFEGLYLVKEPS